MGWCSRGPLLQRRCLASGHAPAQENRGCDASAPADPCLFLKPLGGQSACSYKLESCHGVETGMLPWVCSDSPSLLDNQRR